MSDNSYMAIAQLLAMNAAARDFGGAAGTNPVAAPVRVPAKRLRRSRAATAHLLRGLADTVAPPATQTPCDAAA